MRSYLFGKSCRWGSVVIDWIRSTYLALLSSSILTFVFKISGYSLLTNVTFIFGLLLLIWGLFLSTKISNRFRKLEREYHSSSTIDKSTILLRNHFSQKDSHKIQHLGMYIIWFPAILCLGISGLSFEKQSSENGESIVNTLDDIKGGIHDLDTMILSFKEEFIIIQGLKDTILFLEEDVKLKEREINELNKDISKLAKQLKNTNSSKNSDK